MNSRRGDNVLLICLLTSLFTGVVIDIHGRKYRINIAANDGGDECNTVCGTDLEEQFICVRVCVCISKYVCINVWKDVCMYYSSSQCRA